jgi:hypothetical protein
MIYDYVMSKRKDYGDIYGLFFPMLLLFASIGTIVGGIVSSVVLQTTDATIFLCCLGGGIVVAVIITMIGIISEGKCRDLILWALGAGAIIGFVALCIAPMHAWIVAIFTLGLGEALFIFEKAVPKEKDNRFWFTASRKVINNIESASVVLSLYAVYSLSIPVSKWLNTNREAAINIVGYGTMWILIGLLSLASIYAYIKMNEMKYKKIPIKVKKKRGRPRKV